MLYTSTQEEQKVIETIRDLSPHAYRFEIAQNVDFSRMKVHRIIAKLLERGIIRIEIIGKHSKVFLNDWLENGE